MYTYIIPHSSAFVNLLFYLICIIAHIEKAIKKNHSSINEPTQVTKRNLTKNAIPFLFFGELRAHITWSIKILYVAYHWKINKIFILNVYR